MVLMFHIIKNDLILSNIIDLMTDINLYIDQICLQCFKGLQFNSLKVLKPYKF